MFFETWLSGREVEGREEVRLENKSGKINK